MCTRLFASVQEPEPFLLSYPNDYRSPSKWNEGVVAAGRLLSWRSFVPVRSHSRGGLAWLRWDHAPSEHYVLGQLSTFLLICKGSRLVQDRPNLQNVAEDVQRQQPRSPTSLKKKAAGSDNQRSDWRLPFRKTARRCTRGMLLLTWTSVGSKGLIPDLSHRPASPRG